MLNVKIDTDAETVKATLTPAEIGVESLKAAASFMIFVSAITAGCMLGSALAHKLFDNQ